MRLYVSSTILSATALGNLVALHPDTAARRVLSSGGANHSMGEAGYLRMRKSTLMESSVRIKRGTSQRATARRRALWCGRTVVRRYIVRQRFGLAK